MDLINGYLTDRRCLGANDARLSDYRRIMWTWTSSFGEPRVLFIFRNLHGIFRVRLLKTFILHNM